MERSVKHRGPSRAVVVLVLALAGLVASSGLLAYGSMAGVLGYGAVGYAVVVAPFAFGFVAAAAGLRMRDERA
jgi:hypothetical protein